MRAQLGRLARIEGVRGMQEDRVAALVAGQPASSLSWLPSSPRRRRSARRMRVFTVPRGSPSRVAISLCERPSKKASVTARRSLSESARRAARTRTVLAQDRLGQGVGVRGIAGAELRGDERRAARLRDQPVAAAADAHAVERATARELDQVHPGAAAFRGEAIARAPELQEHLLKDFLGLRLAVQDAHAQSEDERRVASVERIEGAGVSARHELHQVEIVVAVRHPGSARACRPRSARANTTSRRADPVSGPGSLR
jgi:hypothetical protein